ncbi:MAG: recombination-associated protein RdgC, partial [Azoarcus sp.]|nr:recombination-associated protein RdgC [Azoarcus sp.]
DWLAGEAPANFTIDQDCELRSVSEEKATVRYAHHPLDGGEIKDHLSTGKMPTKLALTFNDRVSFVLTDKLELKRLDFLDVVREEVGSEDDAEALFDAEFALMTGELARLIPALLEALGGEVH